MGAAAGRFAHNGGALLRLQIERKFLTSRKGLVGGEYVNGLIDKARPRNPRERPELDGLVIVAISQIVNVRWMAEQI